MGKHTPKTPKAPEPEKETAIVPAPKDFYEFLEDGYPTGIPDNRLSEILQGGDRTWPVRTHGWGYRLDRQHVVNNRGLLVYAIQPNNENKNASKMTRSEISEGTANSQAMATPAQILVPIKGLKITADQAREVFRASMVPNQYGKVYNVVVDTKGECTVDTSKVDGKVKE